MHIPSTTVLTRLSCQNVLVWYFWRSLFLYEELHVRRNSFRSSFRALGSLTVSTDVNRHVATDVVDMKTKIRANDRRDDWSSASSNREQLHLVKK